MNLNLVSFAFGSTLRSFQFVFHRLQAQLIILLHILHSLFIIVVPLNAFNGILELVDLMIHDCLVLLVVCGTFCVSDSCACRLQVLYKPWLVYYNFSPVFRFPICGAILMTGMWYPFMELD